jgi:DNA end-binding protein Ku
VPEDEIDESPSGLRSFWTGTITFGLVSVPVALFPATRSRGVSLRMVDKDGTPLQRRYVCSKDEKPLDWDDIVRGYEIKKEKFVVVTDDELEAVEPRKSREIDLQLFVDVEELDPVFFQRAYFLTPSGGSNKAYRLLSEVMEDTGRAGIATFVMRDKEYLVAILSEKGILRAETMRFHDEIRKPAEIGLPKKPKTTAATSVKRFENAVASRTGKVNFREFLDEQAKALEQLAQKKQKRGEDVVKVAEAQAEEPGGEVVDLLEVLQKTLRGGAAPARKAPKRAPKRAAKARKRGR